MDPAFEPAMFCTRCSAAMIQQDDTAVCSVSGDGLSKRATQRLRRILDGNAEDIERSKLHWGEAWFCPADRQPLIDNFGALICGCGVRLPASFVTELTEFSPHRSEVLGDGAIRQVAGHGSWQYECVLFCELSVEPESLRHVVFPEFDHCDPGYWASWAFIEIGGLGHFGLEWQWSYDKAEPPRRECLKVSTLEDRSFDRDRTIATLTALNIPVENVIYWDALDGSDPTPSIGNLS
jgi:hypothetical protein